ncbi:hypothetical protein RFI_32252, partial [Reticulomyxa filosa]
ARDFYALIKHQATLAESQKKSLQGYLRNFGGLDPSKSRKQLRKILVKEFGQTESEISREFETLTPVICVQRNLMEKKFTQVSHDLMVTRHCMIISENHYSWQLLLECNILNYDHVFLFGSYFENDTCSNISNYNQLNNIIDHMDTGKTVILSNLEDIYEKNVYCRVALGNESRDCHVHKNFKCVVIVQQKEAHSRDMPVDLFFKKKYFFVKKYFTFTNIKTNEKIAFLSRFEKQFISYRDSLPKHLKEYVHALNILSEYFAKKPPTEVFCGYGADTMSSALLYLGIRKAMKTKESKDDEKKEQIQTTNITLDAVKFDDKELRPQLLDLFLPLCRPEEGESVEDQQKKSNNQMLMVITSDIECNVPIEWLHRTKKIVSFKKMSEFEQAIEEFFNSQISNDVLIFQYRYTSTTTDQLEQVIHILQVKHHLFYSALNNSEKKKLIRIIISFNISTVKKRVTLKIGVCGLLYLFVCLFGKKKEVEDCLRGLFIADKFYVIARRFEKTLTDVIDRQAKQANLSIQICLFLFNFSKCAHRAFGRLHFPHSFNTLKEKKLLKLLFNDEEFEECRNILVERSKGLLHKVTETRLMDEILQEVGNGEKKMEGSFFEKRQNNIDTLLVLTFVNVFFAIYQNGGFAKYVESKQKEKKDGFQWYARLFEKALKNRKLIEIKPPSINTSRLLLDAIDPQLCVLQNNFENFFPFSHCIHKWCQLQLCTHFDSLQTNLDSLVKVLRQNLIDDEYSAKAMREYVMDL